MPFVFLIAACAVIQLLGSKDYLASTFFESGDPFPKIFLTALALMLLLIPKEKKWGKTALNWILMAWVVGLAHGIINKSLLSLWLSYINYLANPINLRIFINANIGLVFWTMTHASIWGVSRWGALTTLLVLFYEKIRK